MKELLAWHLYWRPRIWWRRLKESRDPNFNRCSGCGMYACGGRCQHPGY